MSGKREAVKDTFMEMIQTMPIEAVRTEELLKKAGVSKTTFYRLFRDKYDVMNSVYMDFSLPLVQEDPSLSNWKAWTLWDLKNIQKHRSFFRNVVSYEGQNSLREVTRQFYRENILRQVNKSEGGKLGPQLLFTVEALAEVNAFTLIWWIKNGFQPGPEEMISYIESLIPPCLRSYFEEEQDEKRALKSKA